MLFLLCLVMRIRSTMVRSLAAMFAYLALLLLSASHGLLHDSESKTVYYTGSELESLNV